MSKKVTGKQIAQWPEFIALMNRLGVQIDNTREITLRVRYDDAVRLTVDSIPTDHAETADVTTFDSHAIEHVAV